MNFIDFIKELETLNVQLFIKNDKLRYRAPKEILTSHLLSKITQHKDNFLGEAYLYS